MKTLISCNSYNGPRTCSGRYKLPVNLLGGGRVMKLAAPLSEGNCDVKRCIVDCKRNYAISTSVCFGGCG